MAQVIQISQTKFDELLNRITRLETVVAKLLPRSRVSDAPLVDAKTERLIAKSLEDYKAGRYTIIRNQKELEAHLKSL